MFALPFIAVGLTAAYYLGSMLLEWQRMQSWHEVPVRIVSTHLKESRGRQRGSATTYRAQATYRYEYGGEQYTAERVTLSSLADNLGDFQQRTHQELESYRMRGAPFRAFIDSNNPSSAILCRDLRWDIVYLLGVFVLVFTGGGIGLFIGGVKAARLAKEERALAAQNPDEPWMHRAEWRAKRIRGTERRKMISFLATAVVWSLISSPIPFLVWREVEIKGNWLGLIGLLFPLIGILLLYRSLVLVLRYRRFGVSELQLTSLPVVLGERMRGTILARGGLVEATSQAEVTLRCEEVLTSRRRGRTRTYRRALWQRTEPAPVGRFAAGVSAIQVDIEVPMQGASTHDKGDRQIVWVLEANADIPGANFTASFEVPVFDRRSQDGWRFA